MKNLRTLCVLVIAGVWMPCALLAQPKQELVIKASQPMATIQPTMWGVFFEDINMGADGGIYAELIKNRSFEFYMPMMGWKILGKPTTEGDFLVINRGQQNTANPHFLRVTMRKNLKDTIGLINEGFRGMGIKKGLRYDFSIMYRQPGTGKNKLHLKLVNSAGNSIGETTTETTETGDQWKKLAVSFNATATETKAKFKIFFEGEGGIDIDMVSLFPEDTWKQRPGGMRADMIQLLADMKPGFIRFPGGCIVEGRELATRYQWKRTIGPIEERQLIVNRWNTEFAHRPAPDYFQTFGLGFFEYFQLAEDIGAAPLPILNCGMACQFNTAEIVPMDQLDPYIQDALDLVEFANGDVKTPWGKVRAGLGHPAPFNLKMMGVGNENWGPQYIERVKVFTKAIKEKYPYMRLVNSSGTDPVGTRFDYLSGELRSMNADIVDEHYYRSTDWFLKNAARYDSYDRKGPKIFAGEYAAQSDKTVSVDNKNNWQTALSEAAFMTGLERNADLVNMASYAPLFAHAEGWQWTPDMIWVDNLRSYGTPNYYVQKLYSLNKGTDVVPALMNDQPLTGQEGLYASACIDKTSNELIIKIVNTKGTQQSLPILLPGIKTAVTATVTVLKSSLPEINSFDKPLLVSPVEEEVIIKDKTLNAVLAPYSFNVVRLKMSAGATSKK